MAKPPTPIRSDIWKISPDPQQSEWLRLTVAEYRDYLKPLVFITYWNWEELRQLDSTKEQVNHLERLFHKTASNPNPKYGWYFEKAVSSHPSFRKFPSYLRRAAIAEAIGIVSSFVTRWESWKNYDRKHKRCRPPRLTTACASYPVLYKGNMIRWNKAFTACDIKVWNGKDWVWADDIAVVSHGKGRAFIDGYQVKAPSLIANSKGIHLSVPNTFKVPKHADSDRVVGVDIGINTAATAAVVTQDGTVTARRFIHPGQDIDRRDKRRMMVKSRARKTQRIIGKGEKLPKGFCKGLYRKSSNINESIAQKVSREIVDFAYENGAKTIVMENLSSWKAQGGRRGSYTRQRFHCWCKDRIAELVKQKAQEMGIKVVLVNARYTSKYAYDGSGVVKRGHKQYELATFTTGKRYNCDLSASYNIAARYWYQILTGSKYARVWEAEASSQTQRTPVTLSTLWNLAGSANSVARIPT